MGDLLQHIGLTYYYHIQINSVDEDLNEKYKTSYAYYYKCKISMQRKIFTIYTSYPIIETIWDCDMGYFGVK